MTEEQKQTLEIIKNVRDKVVAEEISLSQVPVSDLLNLIQATLGRELVDNPVGMKKGDFAPLVTVYGEMLQRMAEEGDVQGFVQTLHLLERQYTCFERVRYIVSQEKNAEKYKVLARGAGEAYSRLQYDMKQKNREMVTDNATNIDRGTGVVYTCILQNKLKLQQPECINVNWDYICFTDQEDKWGTKEGVWQYRQISIENQEDKNALFRICMMFPDLLLPEYDYSIWVNPKYKIVGELDLFCRSYGRGVSFLAFPSYHKKDVYEAMYTTLHDDDANIEVRKKYLQYKREGYPENDGMISTNVMIRNHHNELIKTVMKAWWDEGVQCRRMWEYGFNYVAWRHGCDYAICDLFIEYNAYFRNVEYALEAGGIE